MAEYGDVVDPFHLVNHQNDIFVAIIFTPEQVSYWGRPIEEGAQGKFWKGTWSAQRRSPYPPDQSECSRCSWTPCWSRVGPEARKWKSSIKSESFSYQATFSLVDGYRLVQHLGEHIDRARNFVCHKLHHCGPVRHHHVQVSLINICETRGSQF